MRDRENEREKEGGRMDGAGGGRERGDCIGYDFFNFYVSDPYETIVLMGEKMISPFGNYSSVLLSRSVLNQNLNPYVAVG